MATKRKATAAASGPEPGDCAICLEVLGPTDAKFVAGCGHTYHVGCAEENFVVGGARNCPCCRAPFENAPGFLAMARAEAQIAARAAAPRSEVAAAGSRQAPAMPDLAAPTGFTTTNNLSPDFASIACVTDINAARKLSAPTRVTVLVTLQFKAQLLECHLLLTDLLSISLLKDDDESNPTTLPTDFVLLADVSGSMNGQKISSVKAALLKLSDMFEPGDRVALVKFNHAAVQLTPLAPLSVEENEACFRREAMQLPVCGGTSFRAAMDAARNILDSRSHVAGRGNPQVLLLTDGHSEGRAGTSDTPPLCASSQHVVWSAMGFGGDHDAATLSRLAERGRGSFSFIESDDVLDEALAAYIGDATRVLSAEVKVGFAFGPGVRLIKLSGPGVVTHLPAGGTELALGAARVNDRREVILDLLIEPPTGGEVAAGEEFSAITVTVSAKAAPPPPPAEARATVGGAAAGASPLPAAPPAMVTAPPYVLKFRSAGPSSAASGGGDSAPAGAEEEEPAEDAAAVEAAREALATAQNRERLVVAAAAVAAAASTAVVTSVLAAAKSTLGGGAAAREAAQSELDALGAAAARNLTFAAQLASETMHSARAQHTLMGSKAPGDGSLSASYRPSKGAVSKRAGMSSKKMLPPPPSAQPPEADLEEKDPTPDA